MKDGNKKRIVTRNPGKFNRTGTVRTRGGKTIELSMSPRDAIKIMCTECLGWEVSPKDCTAPLCPLFQFRGKTWATNDIGEIDAKEED